MQSLPNSFQLMGCMRQANAHVYHIIIQAIFGNKQVTQIQHSIAMALLHVASPTQISYFNFAHVNIISCHHSLTAHIISRQHCLMQASSHVNIVSCQHRLTFGPYYIPHTHGIQNCTICVWYRTCNYMNRLYWQFSLDLDQSCER